jgi:hypothetical protein
MVERQKNSFSVFMEKIVELSEISNCYDIDKMYKIFKLVSNTPLSKNTFAKKMCEWLLQTQSIEYEIKVKNIYTDDIDVLKRQKRQVVCPKDFVQVGRPYDEENDTRLIFNIFDFIEESDDRGESIVDEKNKELGEKPHVNNIKQELF